MVTRTCEAGLRGAISVELVSIRPRSWGDLVKSRGKLEQVCLNWTSRMLLRRIVSSSWVCRRLIPYLRGDDVDVGKSVNGRTPVYEPQIPGLISSLVAGKIQGCAAISVGAEVR